MREGDNLVLASVYSLFDFEVEEFLNIVEDYSLNVHIVGRDGDSQAVLKLELTMMLAIFENIKREPEIIKALL